MLGAETFTSQPIQQSPQRTISRQRLSSHLLMMLVHSYINSLVSSDSTTVISALMDLILSIIITKCPVEKIPKIIKKLAISDEDLLQLESLSTELEIWRGRWLEYSDAPDSLITSLNSYSKESFPNLHILLQIAWIIPATSCEAKRSFSAVQCHETNLRSIVCKECSTALVLMKTNYSLDINVDEVLGGFLRKHPRGATCFLLSMRSEMPL